MLDQYGRVIDYLRVSVTDRCNLRCVYCMPAGGVDREPHETILTFEQLMRLCRVFAALGIRHIRLTGGEPLVHPELAQLVRAIKQEIGFESVSLTTNGLLLAGQLDALLAAGLDGVNISVDALEEETFRAITRREGVAAVRESIDRALAVPNFNVKLNCVPMGTNDSQLVPLAELARDARLAVRFVELMPIGEGKNHSRRTQAEVRAMLERALGPLTPAVGPPGNGPCRYFKASGFIGEIGFISAVSHRFCTSCNRARLTARGFLKTCLQYEGGCDLRALLLSGADDTGLAGAIQNAVSNRPIGHCFDSGPVAGGETRIMSQIGG